MGKEQTSQMPKWLSAPMLHGAARVLAILFVLIIVHESLQPVSAAPNVTHFDKIMHLIAYGALGVVFKLGWPRVNAYALAGALIALGAAVELTQGFMAAGRTASLADGVANSIGVLLGIGFAMIVLRVMRRGEGVSNRNSFRLAPEK